MTNIEWLAEATRRFGDNSHFWKFVCPVCKTVIEIRDYIKAGAPQGAVAISCIGRYLKGSQKAFGNKPVVKGQPCDYTGNGLLNVNPVKVDCDGTIVQVFDFYEVKNGN